MLHSSRWCTLLWLDGALASCAFFVSWDGDHAIYSPPNETLGHGMCSVEVVDWEACSYAWRVRQGDGRPKSCGCLSSDGRFPVDSLICKLFRGSVCFTLSIFKAKRSNRRHDKFPADPSASASSSAFQQPHVDTAPAIRPPQSPKG